MRSLDMRPTFVLGIDAGNTKTIAIVACPDGTITGWGRGGCGDIYGTSPETALDAQACAAHAALKMASVPPQRVQTAVISAAGADWPEDFVTIREGATVRDIGPVPVVYNDAIGGLRAGSPDGTGVAIVCGTGTAIGARSPSGHIWHTSFWQGPQGGAELGRQALKAMVRAELGLGLPTALTQAVLAQCGVNTVEAALHLFTAHGRPHPPITPLAKLLLDAAGQGDATALKIVIDHGRALGEYALVAARKVDLLSEPFYVSLGGGVLRHPSPILANAIVACIQETTPQARPIRAEFEPALGALMLALETASINVDEDVKARLRASAPDGLLFET